MGKIVAARRDREQDRKLLTLDESLALDNAKAMALYGAHLNRYMLQVFDVLGLKDMDVASAQGSTITLRDGRTILDFSGGFGVLGLGHNHPRVLAAERRCHEERVLDCIKIAPHKLQGPWPTTSPASFPNRSTCRFWPFLALKRTKQR
ncbi:aminotransferase class III-fold pyridoxal phosphate-dependent enzyme [Novosphingobium panipatense]